MATKITIRRTATRKDRNASGTVSSFTKTTATPAKITTSKSRASTGFTIPKNVRFF